MSDPVARRQARSMTRTPVRLDIKLRFGDHREFVFKTFDLSSGGTYVVARPPQPVGTLVRFEMQLPPITKPITGFGEVLWIRVRDEGREKPPGMGIQFRYLDEPGEEMLREFLARLAAEAVESDALGREPPASEVVPSSPPPLNLVRPKGPATSVEARPAGSLEGALWPADAVSPPLSVTADEEGISFAAELAPKVEPTAPRSPLAAPTLDSSAALDDLEPDREGEPSSSRRPLQLAIAAALMLVALIVGWWQLRGVSGGRSSESIAAEPSPSGEAGDEEPPEVASAASPSLPAERAIETASALDPDLRPPSSDPEGKLTRLSSIRIGTAEGETIVVISGDGPITAAEVSRQRLGGARPRELLRIAGIQAPYEPAVTSVGTPELVRIRTGHHPEAGGGELYVVFDLPGARWSINRIEHQSGALRVYLRGGK